MLRKDLLNASGKELLEMLDYSEPGLLSLTAFMEIHSSHTEYFSIKIPKDHLLVC